MSVQEASAKGITYPHLQLEPQLQLDPQLHDIFFFKLGLGTRLVDGKELVSALRLPELTGLKRHPTPTPPFIAVDGWMDSARDKDTLHGELVLARSGIILSHPMANSNSRRRKVVKFPELLPYSCVHVSVFQSKLNVTTVYR